VQTWHPRHALFAALRAHDYARFADSQLTERRSAGLPPFAHLALLRAEAREVGDATGFLRGAAEVAAAMPEAADVMVYPPVPPAVSRVANIERMQMLVESRSRSRLQRFLSAWLPRLHEMRSHHKRLARWAVDVDPLGI
jgi:primosomal protein N' (replication factor Y)